MAFAVSISVGDTVSAAPTAVGSCPRPTDAATLPERRAGGLLRADIDGDRVRDRVSIRYAPRARASCGFLLVVATRGRTLSVRVPEWYKPPQDLPVSKWPFAEPFVAVIVRLNAHRSQVVVAREHGAAVVNVSLYGVFRGELELIHFPAPRRDRLSLFGTVGTGDTNVRCKRGGPLIVLSRSPTTATGNQWRFDRTHYRLAGDRFSVIRKRSTVVPETETPTVSRRWNFDVKPFAGCAVARGRRL